MSVRFLALLIAAIVTLAVTGVGCNGPFALLPGGRLYGEVKAAPSDWAFAGEYGTVQLETHPEDPYSVNIAFTVIEGRLYINAGDTQTRWVKNIAASPPTPEASNEPASMPRSSERSWRSSTNGESKPMWRRP